MSQKQFKNLATTALECTKKGLDLLTEVYELQVAAKQMSMSSDYTALIKEIAEKQKMAVEFIQQATLIERGMMRQQEEDIKKLIADLP
jgi:small-conductance mechanosensitive channel